MNELCRAEVYDFHRFLMKWFTSTEVPSELEFVRFTDVLATDFQLVTPEARLLDKAELHTYVWKAHGAHARSDVPFRIWVENYSGRPIGEGLYLCMYEEWQDTNGVVKGRQSSAIFRPDDQTRNGVVWVHVHETWLAGREPLL